MFQFNSTSLIATLTYEIDPSITEPSVIFASTTFNYPTGFDVSISPKDKATWSVQDNDHIIISHTSPVTKSVITVTVTPKKAIILSFK